MAKIERFEDLVAWQKGRILIRDIYAVSARQPFSRDFAMCDQIRRAALSITSNIAEGFERAVHGDFQRFLVYAKASCAEVRSQLYSALDVGHLDQPTFDKLMTNAQEVGRIIGGLRSSIERRRTAQHSALSTQHS